MKYSKTIEDMFSLEINDSLVATVKGDTDQPPATVQLENDAEADKMIKEFEDPEGELMHADGAIFGKYPQLHQFKP